MGLCLGALAVWIAVAQPSRPAWHVVGLAVALGVGSAMNTPLRAGRQSVDVNLAVIPLAMLALHLPADQALVAVVVGTVGSYGVLQRRAPLKAAVNSALATCNSMVVVLAVAAGGAARADGVASLGVLLAALTLVEVLGHVEVHWIVSTAAPPDVRMPRPGRQERAVQALVALAVSSCAVSVMAIVVPGHATPLAALPVVAVAGLAVWVFGRYAEIFDGQRHLLAVTRRLWDAEGLDVVLTAALADVDTVLPVDDVEVVVERRMPGRVDRWTWELDGLVARPDVVDPSLWAGVQRLHDTGVPDRLGAAEAPIAVSTRTQRVGAPFRLEDGSRAMLAVGSDRRASLDRADHRELLHSLALQLGFAMSRARLGVALDSEKAGRQHVLTHDALTGLPNRRAWVEQVGRLVDGARLSDGHVAVAVLDIAGFARCNDTLGHAAGDEVLVEVARRLRSALRDGDVLARMGADVFGVALAAADDLEQTVRICDRLLATFNDHFDVGGLVLTLHAHLGVATAPEHGDAADLLLQRAEIALSAAKERRVPWSHYLADDTDAGRRRLLVQGALRRAIGDGDLDVHFQPKVDARDGRPRGFEALARWEDPQLGFVSPAEFIPVAEETGLMPALTRVVVDRALDALCEWQADGHRVGLAINVSPSALLDDTVRADVLDGLARRGLAAGALTIELTEEALVAGDAVAVAVQQLTELGVQLSIDDYGRGYSSLSRLLGLSTDELKVDRSFVSRLTSDEQAAVIVRSTLDLAAGLGLRTVAEGVEHEDEAILLREMGVDLLQGWLTGHPMTRDAAREWLSAPERHWTPPVDATPVVALHGRRA